MQKLLVTGASGFLGWNVCQLAKQQWEVYGTYFSKAIEIPGATLVKADVRDFEELKRLFAEIKPAAVIHTAAQSSPNYCQLHPDECYPLNVTAAWNIAGLCADYSIPCIFTSTDQVFNGLNPPYRETDPVCPISHYGEYKVKAEQGMLERYPKTAACRMPLMFGIPPAGATSFIQPFIQILREGKELSLFTDQFRTPASGKTAATGLLLAIEKIQGIIHLGGKERVSRYEFGQLMAEVFELPQDKLKACLQDDVPMPAPRPVDVSLNSEKAFALGYQPLSLREELENLRGYL